MTNTTDHDAEFAAHAAKVSHQDAAEGRPGYHRDASNSPAWRNGYDTATTLHVVIRPAGKRGTLTETYAAAVRPGTDPKRAALELAADVAMYEDSTTVEYRVVLATDAGAARHQWPRKRSHSAGGSFRMADEAHTVSPRYAAPRPQRGAPWE